MDDPAICAGIFGSAQSRSLLGRNRVARINGHRSDTWIFAPVEPIASMPDRAHHPVMRRLPTRLAALLGLVLVVVGAACGGDEESRTYSADEVLSAFEAAAYPLVEQPPPAGTAAAAEGTYLFPRAGAPLVVAVGTDQGADDAWPDYVRLGGDEDSLTIRRANVVAISDGGLPSTAKARVRSAMHALPDRGYAVDVVEDR